MKDRSARRMRLQHANELIRVISSHGRRFFCNKSTERVACLEIDQRGRLWFIDDYKGARIYTGSVAGRSHGWTGFSHGGTLLSLVQDICSYVDSGDLLDRFRIATPYQGDSDRDLWGYGVAAAIAVREDAYRLPIFNT